MAGGGAGSTLMGSRTSGYVQRGNDRLPRQGTHGPWRVRNDYLFDAPMLRRAPIDDGIVQFTRVAAGASLPVAR